MRYVPNTPAVFLVGFALIAIGVGPATACEADAAQVNNGKTVYQQTCVACHGPNGKGTVPGAPDFTANSSPLKKDDEVLLKNIVEGFKSPGSPMAMPAKGGNPSLTDEDIRAVIVYMRDTFGK